jgi:hypothetical protein
MAEKVDHHHVGYLLEGGLETRRCFLSTLLEKQYALGLECDLL